MEMQERESALLRPHSILCVLTSQYTYDTILDVEVSNIKLRRLRQEKAWSIRELSERASVSTETIYSLEHSRREWAWPRSRSRRRL
jgi:DNA-binding XRE family transcriptional regulator